MLKAGAAFSTRIVCCNNLVNNFKEVSSTSKSAICCYHFSQNTSSSFNLQPGRKNYRQTCRRVLPIVPSHSSQQSSRLISSSAVLFAKQVEWEGDESLGGSDKVLKLKLATTRLDAIIKAGLNISRNKIEKAFYDDRIRINGERPKKKSQMLDEGDEVDIVRGTNKLNPLFLDVNRVEILDINLSSSSSGNSKNSKNKSSKRDSDDEDSDEEDSGDKIPIVIKRYKNYTIQNYPVPWKGGVSDL